MNIGRRLRELREAKGLSQGHIERRTGVFRSYISRIECGHTEPKLETLEKWAKALDLEVYQLFYEGRGKPKAPKVLDGTVLHRREKQLFDLFRRMRENNKSLFLGLAREAVNKLGKHE